MKITELISLLLKAKDAGMEDVEEVKSILEIMKSK